MTKARTTWLFIGAAFAANCAGVRPVLADVQPQTSTGVPPQVIPQAVETGAPLFVTPSGGVSSTDSGGGGMMENTGSMAGSGSSFNQMMSQSYGQTANDTAQQLGINPNAIAGIGQMESDFQNVSTANGTSSATGPWQITTGTWDDYVSKYNLPYATSDRTSPEAQAVVANYILKDYSALVSAATQQPATVEQAYGAYVFGPSVGANIAGASSSSPLSNYVSSAALANNNMVGYTVGQFYSRVSSKIGSVATQTVRS